MTKKFQRYGVSLYLDGTGFVYNANPMDQAFSPNAKEWQRTNEGLNCRCTNEGKQKGLTQAKFMVAISYDRRVVTCEQYISICDSKFAKMTNNCLPKAFDLNIHPMKDGLFRMGTLAKALLCPGKSWRIQALKWSMFQHAILTSTALKPFLSWSKKHLTKTSQERHFRNFQQEPKISSLTLIEEP